ncbi:MAG: PAS domain-containing protein [Gemmatimonadetes bacterium]|nr:PAS domain-containing protein [Gemmatimonadota bacterium]
MERTQSWLRWLYIGRLVVATAIFVAALTQWFRPDGSPFETLVATIALLSALAMTAFGLWWVELGGRTPQRNFLYIQVLFDVLLVTAAVHVTGGPNSPFPPLYILVITAGALLLPLPGGMLIGALASILFFADVVFLHPTEPATQDFLRIVLFCVMAVAMAAVGDRLRRTGTALGAVESELRKLRLETGDILDGIDTALVTVDGRGRLMYMNTAAVKLLGIGADDIEVRPVLDELEQSAPGLGRLIRRTAATRVPVGRFEIRRTTAEGARYLSVRTTVLDRDDEPTVTAVIQDISEARQIDDLLHRAERLEAVAALGASLAHEIKNPLASIRSAAEQLGGTRLRVEDRDKLNLLIVSESERLSRLLTEFMEFSRFDAQRWSSVDLGRVAGDVIDLVTRHPDRSGGMRIDFARPDVAVVVDGDHDLLHRAVFNLVLNAVQHAGPEGVVTVEVDQPNGDLPATVELPDAVRLRVRDTGPGVSEEDIPRMFDPFFTKRSGGTGLGLALVHRAVEAHRGTILVDSPAGAGACFTIYLPAHAGREPGDGRAN